MTAEIFLWLFIINLGTAFGAGIYELRIVLPMWFKKEGNDYKVDAKAMAETDSGRKFWSMVTTLPLTLLTIANIVYAVKASEPQHSWWLASVLISLVERISTFTFFIPNAIRLMKSETMEASKVTILAKLWLGANYVRCLFTLVAMITAMRVLSLPH